ncbi:MAG: hypothetical protein CMD92_06575 [Gammaproteobacteria bacterium]|nr:hypothetical protein [Gammaproteobacteria bacterium]HBW83569.1 hypothetical protein [Gammaproteobacteria bacterium]
MSVLVNWSNFYRRAYRSEFWYFGLAPSLLGVTIGAVKVATGMVDLENAGRGSLSFTLSFAMVLPYLSETPR